MPTWTNNDGLTIYYGASESVPATGGEYESDGLWREVEVKLDLTTLTSTAGTVVSRVQIPFGYQLGRVEVIADTAATSSGSATLDVGFKRMIAGTENDYNGAVAALPLANINVEGELNRLDPGVTYAGALVGKVVEADEVSLVTANYNTAAFTAGKVRVRFFLNRKYA
jgi:hypothetical protein